MFVGVDFSYSSFACWPRNRKTRVATNPRQLYDLDVTIDSRADEIRYVKKGTMEDIGSLADWLSRTLVIYQENRADQKSKIVPALVMQEVIAKLYSNGVVNPGEGLLRKYRECENRCEELKNELNDISIRLIDLEKENDKLAGKLNLLNDDDLEDQR